SHPSPSSPDAPSPYPTLFRSSSRTDPVPAALPAPPAKLLPSGPPAPLMVARYGDLRIQLPIPQSRVTAIGYHAAGEGVLALDARSEEHTSELQSPDHLVWRLL